MNDTNSLGCSGEDLGDFNLMNSSKKSKTKMKYREIESLLINYFLKIYIYKYICKIRIRGLL